MRTVTLVGVGTVGLGWAAFFAAKGLTVRLYDARATAVRDAPAAVRQRLEALCGSGLMAAAAVEPALARLVPAATLEEACAGADLVQESAAEDTAVKRALFESLDRLLGPDVIIASSSSGLLISELQAGLRHPERALIAHPFHPAHLMPLVELVGGRATASAVVERARAFYEGLGKTAVVLRREIPGHLANRLAAAVWREAIDLVASGAASVEDVDRALCAGPGLRWAFMGPHLTYHLGGGKGGYAHFIEHVGPTFEACWRDMATWTALPAGAAAALSQGVEAEVAGRSPEELAAWRDRRLAAVLRAVQD